MGLVAPEVLLTNDIAQLAGIAVTWSDVKDVEALKCWLRQEARLSASAIQTMHPSEGNDVPAGRFVLQSTPIYADFPARAILDQLIETHLPRVMRRMARQLMSDGASLSSDACIRNSRTLEALAGARARAILQHTLFSTFPRR
jgi:hypothetical protein